MMRKLFLYSLIGTLAYFPAAAAVKISGMVVEADPPELLALTMRLSYNPEKGNAEQPRIKRTIHLPVSFDLCENLPEIEIPDKVSELKIKVQGVLGSRAITPDPIKFSDSDLYSPDGEMKIEEIHMLFSGSRESYLEKLNKPRAEHLEEFIGNQEGEAFLSLHYKLRPIGSRLKDLEELEKNREENKRILEEMFGPDEESEDQIRERHERQLKSLKEREEVQKQRELRREELYREAGLTKSWLFDAN